MRLASVLLVVLTAACGPTTASRFEIVRPPEVASCRPVFSVVANPPPEFLQDARTPLRVLLGVTARFDCTDMVARGFERLDIQMVDERGAPAGRVLARSDNGPGFSRLELELQPGPRMGSVDVTVQAEPTLGRQVLTYRFVPTRSAAWEPLGSVSCTWLRALPDGRRACALRGSRTVSVLAADGGVEATVMTGIGSLLVGRDWWTLQPGEQPTAIVYHFDLDGGLRPEAIDAGFRASAIASRGDRVVLGGLTRARTVVLEEFSPSGRVRLESALDGGGPILGPQAMLFLSDEQLLVVRTNRTIERWPVPSRSDGGLFPGPMVLDRGPLAVTDEGIWLTDDSRLTLLRPDGGSTSAPTIVPLQSGWDSHLLPVGLVDGTGLVIVPVERDAGLELDPLRLPAGWQLGGVTSEWIYATDQFSLLYRTPRQ